MTDPLIDWVAIGKAVTSYNCKGYTSVSVPWMVEGRYSRATCGDISRSYETKNGLTLVGSAEQSFIQEDAKGRLGDGRFVAVTPCFRDEPVVDLYHQKSFIKVELYSNTGDLIKERDKMIDSALDVISSRMFDLCRSKDVIPPNLTVERVDEGFDITCGGVELGSYGIRSFEDTMWAYGTGLAEPRMSALTHSFIEQACEKTIAYNIDGDF